MNHAVTIIERAFQLARGGSCRSVADIRRALKAERYEGVEQHLGGPLLSRQLNAAIKEADAR